MKNILVTGGAGFIGSNFIRYLLLDERFDGSIVNLDKLTYAGNLMSLRDVAERREGKGYEFVRGDIADYPLVADLFKKHRIDTVVHFAAESHVDRSIHGPADFVQTNIVGTFNLLDAARASWKSPEGKRFHHISTDEVFGSAEAGTAFTEASPYDPSSPYSATKASSDHLVRAYVRTYGMPATISNCSNNYGPYQHPEKLIPLMVLNASEGKELPIYGDGGNVRDWLHVLDHCSAISLILKKGRVGETYNVGGRCEKRNIEIVERICAMIEQRMPGRKCAGLIKHVTDRRGHDRRYAIDSRKIELELGWKPRRSFDQGLAETVDWYLANREWVDAVRSGEYMKWIEKNYSMR